MTDLEVKWKDVIEYTSNKIKPVPQDKREYVASKLEEYDNLFCKYSEFRKRVIPHVRIMEGDIEYTFGMVKGEICMITKGLLIYRGPDPIPLAIPFTDIKNPSDIYSTWGAYILNSDEEWEWVHIA